MTVDARELMHARRAGEAPSRDQVRCRVGTAHRSRMKEPRIASATAAMTGSPKAAAGAVAPVRQVAKEGALAATSASKPGVGKTPRDVELDAAHAEIARLSEAMKELAVKLTLLEGKVSLSSTEEARSGLKMGVRSPADVVSLWSREAAGK